MRRGRRATLCFLTVILAFITVGGAFSALSEKTVFASPEPSEIVIESASRRIISSSNAYMRRGMASTTKIMTTLCALESCKSLDEPMTVPDEAIGIEGSSIYLEKGERLTLRELLYGVMLRSGNDAATAVAILCAGSVDAFCENMNKRVLELGLTDTHFDNPHGLDGKTHYTTAYDLAIIASEAMKNSAFREIASARSFRISGGEYGRTLVNKNKLLGSFDGATGIKIGFTKKCGKCFVASAKRGDTEFICVELGVASMFDPASKAIEKAFSDCKNVVILPQYAYLGAYSAITGERAGGGAADAGDTVRVYHRDGFVYPLFNGESDRIMIRVEPDIEKLKRRSESVGRIKIFLGDEMIYLGELSSICGISEKSGGRGFFNDILNNYLLHTPRRV